ncbi:MAG TPA: GNAT family N-acetyltransferase [Burkholderiales bacterium]
MSLPLPAESPPLAARLASALRRLGWKRFMAQCYRRGLSLLVRHATDIVLRKDLAEGDEARPGTLLQLRPFDGRDPAILERIAAAQYVDSPDMELLRIYVGRGYRALFAEVDDRIVGHIWWVDAHCSSDRAHPDLARYGIRLGPREAYAFNFFLEPGSRGGGNANEFLSRFEQHLRSRGIERVWGFVADDNKPARWLYSLCGWKPSKVMQSVEIARCLLFSQTGVFVRNSRRRKRPSHGYRRLA